MFCLTKYFGLVTGEKSHSPIFSCQKYSACDCGASCGERLGKEDSFLKLLEKEISADVLKKN